MRNKAQIRHFPKLGNLDLLLAEFSDHHFDVHWHDTWSIGVVLSGAHDNSPKGNGEGLVTSGEVTIIPPGQVHAGKVVGDQACRYLMLYSPYEVVNEAIEQNGAKVASLAGKVIERQRLAAELAFLATALTNEASDDLECDISWANCLMAFSNTVSGLSSKQAPDAEKGAGFRILRARDYLHAHSNDVVRLDDLAAASGLSKFNLCRLFATRFGLPPHRYHRQLRLQLARRQLREGKPIADVAIDCGFSDQAHLGRQFKASFGLSPGAFSLRKH